MRRALRNRESEVWIPAREILLAGAGRCKPLQMRDLSFEPAFTEGG